MRCQELTFGRAATLTARSVVTTAENEACILNEVLEVWKLEIAGKGCLIEGLVDVIEVTDDVIDVV